MKRPKHAITLRNSRAFNLGIVGGGWATLSGWFRPFFHGSEQMRKNKANLQHSARPTYNMSRKRFLARQRKIIVLPSAFVVTKTISVAIKRPGSRQLQKTPSDFKVCLMKTISVTMPAVSMTLKAVFA